MSYKLYVFPAPQDSLCELIHDSNGISLIAQVATHPTGRVGQVFTLPEAIPDKNGATLLLSHPDYYTYRFRGIVSLNDPSDGLAVIGIDDFTLIKVPLVPEVPPVPPVEPPGTGGPDPNANPMDIINYTYNSTSPNLATHVGCGQFTEDCCEALHNSMHPAWGHVKKNPGQNQYNGHAVDAIMLLVPSGGTGPGIYDIIFDSVSSNARPAFNYAGPVDGDLWLYPPGVIATRNA